MAITPETQAADVANRIIGVAAQLNGIAQQIAAISAQWTNGTVATKLNAFPTAPLLTTGALGTADGSPNTANPIDTRTTDGALINRAISATTLAGLLTYLQGIGTAIGGGAISANGASVQQVAQTL